MPLSTGKRPLIVIVGPTAIGKTALSLQLAQRWPVEVLSADSRLFYRGMDIGTAKPTVAERATVPHHLIDLVDPDQTLTLGEYQALCYATIDAVHARGRLPLLVGGTGQYVQAIVEGWGIPRVPPQPALRAQLMQQPAEQLYARLQALDPAAAAKLHPNNVRRIVRALEVCLVSGQPISELQRKQPPPYAVTQIGLTCARELLYARVDARADAMIVAGLLDEVRALAAAGYGRALPAMSGLGYRQLWEYLAGEMSYEEAIQRIKHETHRFVRHQYNWFGSADPAIAWFDIADAAYPANAIAHVAAWLAALVTTPGDHNKES